MLYIFVLYPCVALSTYPTFYDLTCLSISVISESLFVLHSRIFWMSQTARKPIVQDLKLFGCFRQLKNQLCRMLDVGCQVPDSWDVPDMSDKLEHFLGAREPLKTSLHGTDRPTHLKFKIGKGLWRRTGERSCQENTWNIYGFLPSLLPCGSTVYYWKLHLHPQSNNPKAV